MPQYKFRAECPHDVAVLSNVLVRDKHRHMIINRTMEPGYPDVEIELDIDLTRPELISIMRTIEDGHVMRQTVQPIESYTGNRDYTL